MFVGSQLRQLERFIPSLGGVALALLQIRIEQQPGCGDYGEQNKQE
ncbi:MAG: hypothetical protein HYR71_04065 [Chloroflexi bacterium]|nr:hypothetical protein [Chloroflexota bacterium]